MFVPLCSIREPPSQGEFVDGSWSFPGVYMERPVDDLTRRRIQVVHHGRREGEGFDIFSLRLGSKGSFPHRSTSVVARDNVCTVPPIHLPLFASQSPRRCCSTHHGGDCTLSHNAFRGDEHERPVHAVGGVVFAVVLMRLPSLGSLRAQIVNRKATIHATSHGASCRNLLEVPFPFVHSRLLEAQ